MIKDMNDNSKEEFPKILNYRYWGYQNDEESCIEEECPCFFPPLYSKERELEWQGCFKLAIFYIIIIQIILFIATIALSDNNRNSLSPDVKTLLSFCASNSDKIWLKSQFWRLITPIALHANLIHITMNTLGQLVFCLGLEKNWGSIKFIQIYVGSGIIGCMITSSVRVMNCGVGASGALFGILGAYITFLLLKISSIANEDRSFAYVLPFVAGVGLIGSELVESIDNIGHLAGLFGGSFISLVVLNESLPLETGFKWKMIGVTGIVFILITGLIFGLRQ